MPQVVRRRFPPLPASADIPAPALHTSLLKTISGMGPKDELPQADEREPPLKRLLRTLSSGAAAMGSISKQSSGIPTN